MTQHPQPLEKFLSRQRRKRHLAGIWADLAGLAPGMTILDIGSGPAILAAAYAALTGPAGTVYALEPAMAPAAPAANLIHLAQDATARIDLPTSPDRIFVTDTLHHAADPAAILRNLRPLCAPRTRLLVAEYDPEQPGLVGAKPPRRMARETALTLLENAGFAILTVIDSADEHYAILAAPA